MPATLSSSHSWLIGEWFFVAWLVCPLHFFSNQSIGRSDRWKNRPPTCLFVYPFSTSPAPCSFVRVFHSFKNLRKSKMERKYHTQQSVSEEKMLWVGWRNWSKMVAMMMMCWSSPHSPLSLLPSPAPLSWLNRWPSMCHYSGKTYLIVSILLTPMFAWLATVVDDGSEETCSIACTALYCKFYASLQ